MGRLAEVDLVAVEAILPASYNNKTGKKALQIALIFGYFIRVDFIPGTRQIIAANGKVIQIRHGKQ
jgi:hypothetical protein